jgi:hypothetical protein
MTKPQLSSLMIKLQDEMKDLQVKEAMAHERKLKAESDIEGCGKAWYIIYKQYLHCKEKLNALNK